MDNFDYYFPPVDKCWEIVPLSPLCKGLGLIIKSKGLVKVESFEGRFVNQRATPVYSITLKFSVI